MVPRSMASATLRALRTMNWARPARASPWAIATRAWNSTGTMQVMIRQWRAGANLTKFLRRGPLSLRRRALPSRRTSRGHPNRLTASKLAIRPDHEAPRRRPARARIYRRQLAREIAARPAGRPTRPISYDELKNLIRLASSIPLAFEHHGPVTDQSVAGGPPPPDRLSAARSARGDRDHGKGRRPRRGPPFFTAIAEACNTAYQERPQDVFCGQAPPTPATTTSGKPATIPKANHGALTPQTL